MACFPISQKHALLGRPLEHAFVEIGEPDFPNRHFTQMQIALQTGQLFMVIWNPVINSKMSFSWRSAEFRRDRRWCQDLLAASPQLLVCIFPQCFVTGFHANCELVSVLECLILPCPFLLFISQHKYPLRCNMCSTMSSFVCPTVLTK